MRAERNFATTSYSCTAIEKKNIFNQEKTKKPYLLERYSHGAQLPLKVLRCSSFSKVLTWGLASKIRCVQQFSITCNGRMASVVQELKKVGRMTFFFFFQIWLVLLFNNKLSQSETKKSLFFVTKSDDILSLLLQMFISLR